MQIVSLISFHLSVVMYFVGSNVSFYLYTGDGTTYNMSNSFNDNIFNSSNYTVFGLYNFTSFIYFFQIAKKKTLNLVSTNHNQCQNYNDFSEFCKVNYISKRQAT